MDKMVTIFDEGGTADGAGGSVDATEFVRITLAGRDYIEKQRKELLCSGFLTLLRLPLL